MKNNIPAPTEEQIDCHYCEYGCCYSPDSDVDCYVDDFSYFDHKVKNSKEEAEECVWFYNK